MPKINQEEYEILKTKLREGYKWVAKEMALNVWVRVYKEHPDIGFPGIAVTEANNLFQFIQWEDEEPYNIAKLIEEYEKDYKGSWEHAIEFSGEVFGESEETEVKNIEELKSWFEDDKYYEGEYVNHKIDQLDEPEVLSPELPVIPKFVTYVIEAYKSNSSLTNLLADLAFHGGLAEFVEHEDEGEVFEWARSNRKATDEILARAWLYDFTVEEEREQKYYVDLDTAAYVAKWDGDGSVQIYTDSVSGSDEYELHLTEQEIKDYDPRYWAFRKPVEEMEG